MVQVRCYACAAEYQLDRTRWRCDCGGVFDLVDHIQPFSNESYARITMGESGTPLVCLNEQQPQLKAKLEYVSPTGSFKDRGASALLAYALDLGVDRVVADSSGNAGVSIAAYATRAAIDATVFIGENTSPKKVKQLRALGAEVVSVAGTREDVAAAAQAMVEARQLFYASHVFNPVFNFGVSRIAAEIVEQLGSVPSRLLLPVGNGTLVLGALSGFARLGDVPTPVIVQAQGCAPIAKAFASGEPVLRGTNSGTLAEGIAIADPARGQQILDTVRAHGGGVLTVNDAQVTDAQEALARLGFYVEPTAAVTYAAATASPTEELTVTVLCGSGLKSD